MGSGGFPLRALFSGGLRSFPPGSRILGRIFRYSVSNKVAKAKYIKNIFILKSNIYKIPIAIRLLIVYDMVARYGKPKRPCFSGKIPVSTTIL